MLTLLGAVAALVAPPRTLPVPRAAITDRGVALYRLLDDDARPKVSVWTNSTDPYQRGDRVRVYVSAETDAYVTVLRVDTDGRIRVLYPLEPWQDNFVRGGRTFEVLGRDDDNAFDVDDYPGVGYVFAVASADPFSYDPYVRNDHWDYRVIADGRVTGDPYVTLTDFAGKIAGQDDWDYDITPYYVDKQYEYPRFICYNCHAYASYSYWDPYQQYCPRFRVVVYNDPYYYPYYYGGRRTVVVRPIRPQPRFIFKDNTGGGGTNFVTVLDRRPVRPAGDGGQSVIPDRGRTGADVGGRGSIPTPQGFGRRPTRPTGGETGAGGREVQPDVGGIGSMRRPVTGGQGQGSTTGSGGAPQTPPGAGGRRMEPNTPPPTQGGSASPERRPDPQPGRTVEPRPMPQPRPPEHQPQAEPRREAPPPRMERPAPRAEGRRGGGGGGGTPELRRRKP
jgi:hypothetical protein